MILENQSMPIPSDFPKFEDIREIIQLSRHEDLHDDDVTSRLMVPEDAIGVGTLLQKKSASPAACRSSR
jgi:hypothetical protein